MLCLIRLPSAAGAKRPLKSQRPARQHSDQGRLKYSCVYIDCVSNQYTGLHQCTGGVKRAGGRAERSSAIPPRLVMGGAWRRRRRPNKIPGSRRFRFLPQYCRGSILAGGGCGHRHRKERRRKFKKKMNGTCGDNVTIFTLFFVRAGAAKHTFTVNVTPSLLPLGHRIVGALIKAQDSTRLPSSLSSRNAV